jgi:hypothetical protein
MIVRHDSADLVCITQPDHAALAGRLIEAWCADGFPTRPTRARVVRATSLHDTGWEDIDAAPQVDLDTGAPFDFLSAPVDLRQSLWPRAVTTLAQDDPYIAALVAQHALTVYRRHQHDPVWRSFFPRLERLRDDLYDEARQRATAPLTSFLQDYSLVGIGDLCSLVFCNGWTEPHLIEGYQAILRGSVLTIAPDPFGGLAVPFDVRARRLPARRYRSDTELQDAWAAATPVTLTGLAVGEPAMPVS